MIDFLRNTTPKKLIDLHKRDANQIFARLVFAEAIAVFLPLERGQGVEHTPVGSQGYINIIRHCYANIFLCELLSTRPIIIFEAVALPWGVMADYEAIRHLFTFRQVIFIL